MRYACIFCEVLFRECCLAAAESDAVIDFIQLPKGLHDTPDELRRRVQSEIDKLEGGPEHITTLNNEAVPAGKYDAILLGYALCSNGIVGLSTAKTPLIVPRAHDCISLLLGSKETYREYFDTHHGAYWYSAGWIERGMTAANESKEDKLARYIEKYGEDNAEYLLEMEESWVKEYQWGTYINWELSTVARDRQFTRDCASYFGWNYDEIPADRRLLYDFFNGQWDNDRFLIVRPGEHIEPSNDPTIIKACSVAIV